MRKFTMVEFKGMPCVEQRWASGIPGQYAVGKMQPMMGFKEMGSGMRWALWRLSLQNPIRDQPRELQQEEAPLVVRDVALEELAIGQASSRRRTTEQPYLRIAIRPEIDWSKLLLTVGECPPEEMATIETRDFERRRWWSVMGQRMIEVWVRVR